MKSVHLLFSRLVRTQAGLHRLQVPSVRQIQQAQALCMPVSEFGDPDKFGDLKQNVEKRRPQETDIDTSERSGPGAERFYKDTGHGAYSGDGSGPDGRGGGGASARRKQTWDQRWADGESLKPDQFTPSARHSVAIPDSHPAIRTARSETARTAPTTTGKTAAASPTDNSSRTTWGASSAAKGATGMTADVEHTSEGASVATKGVHATESATTAATDGASSVIDWELETEDAEDLAAERLREVVSQIPRLDITCHAYGRRFKSMIKNGKLREALELFNNQMLQVDKVQPDEYCYNVLISGCAQAGYSKMAFKLYRDMRRRRLRVKHVTYTSLLHACANGPSASDGLRRLEQLTAAMAERGYVMNPINYQALIKAYGRCGQLERAFETADELLRRGHPLTADLASHLLQACVSDTGHGFRHALLVWHKLRSQRVAPSIYLYNLMLRATLDCGAGDVTTFERAMQLILSAPPPPPTGAVSAGTGSASASTIPNAVAAGADMTSASAAASQTASQTAGRTAASPGNERALAEPADGNRAAQPSSDAGAAEGIDLTPTSERQSQENMTPTGKRQPQAEVSVTAVDLPNLLSSRPHRGGLVELRHLDTADVRLSVLGGWTGLLQNMAADAIRPDVKTFSLLVKTMSNDSEQQQSLLRTMDALEVQPDVAFFNQLMQKRASCRDSTGARAAFSELERRGLTPDVASFGCLAMSVTSMDQLQQFMDRLQAADVRPNVEILTTLLNSAARSVDVQRALAVMEAFVAHQVRPDRRALHRLEELRLRLQTLIVDRERDRPVPAAARRSSFPEWVRKFKLRYAGWLSETELEPEPHPHSQHKVRPVEETAAEMREYSQHHQEQRQKHQKKQQQRQRRRPELGPGEGKRPVVAR